MALRHLHYGENARYSNTDTQPEIPSLARHGMLIREVREIRPRWSSTKSINGRQESIDGLGKDWRRRQKAQD